MVATTLYGDYTTISGLMGIVKNETIWATNIRFLNDEHEFQHALKLVGYIIQDSKITPEFAIYVKYKDYIKKSQASHRLSIATSQKTYSHFRSPGNRFTEPVAGILSCQQWLLSRIQCENSVRQNQEQF